jgi:hypothetical protein
MQVGLPALLAACSSADPAALPGPSGTPDSGVVVPPSPPPEPPPFAPAPATLHRLTLSQYQGSLTALLGPAVVVPEDLEVDTPLHGFSTVGAAELTVGPRAVEQYEAAALDVAHQVFQDPAWRQALVGCDVVDATDPCVTAFLTRFGRRAWRRPLTDEELGAYAGLAAALGQRFQEPWYGVELMVAALLESPNFLYRVEVGEPAPEAPERRRFTGYEMAARLAYFIWNEPPDDALLDAAAAGALDTAEGVAAAARGMVADPRARPALIRFFDEHLKLDRLLAVSKDPALFPQLTDTLTRSMRTEVHKLIEAVAFEGDQDLRRLFTTRETFVNGELARLYNLPAVEGEGFVAAEHPAAGPRAGVLSTAAFATLNAHNTVTSPTLRGRYVRQSVLCQDIPPPPPGVTTELPEPDPNQGPETLRQRLERLHLGNTTCAGCHNLMDPIGFAFENFDPVGAYRTTENGLPIDPRGALDGAPFAGARSLSELLAENPRVADCLARMAYRYASGHLETRGETRVLKQLAEVFRANGFKLSELVVALVSSDGFRYAAGEEG